MNKNRIKQLLLLLLIFALIYVWWDAFNLLSPTKQNYIIRDEQNTPDSNFSISNNIQFRSPKINPFLIKSRIDNKKKVKAKPQRRATPPLAIGEGYKLSGLIKRGVASQAVIMLPNGATKVLSVGDSLSKWELISIDENAAIFKHEKKRDTIWLYSSDK